MKYLDEYRDERIAHGLVAEITRCVTRPWVLMEICGSRPPVPAPAAAS